MKILSMREVSDKLEQAIWFIRDRNFKYPMTSEDVCCDHVSRTIPVLSGTSIVADEDVHRLEDWIVGGKFKIETESDVLNVLQTLKADIIKFETEKVKQYGDKKCTCYQQTDWRFLDWHDGMCGYALKISSDNTYEIMVVKYAVILEDVDISLGE